MGTIGRVQGTEAPGKMSKQLVNAMMNQMVVSEDCGTKKGVLLSIDDRDILDRFTSEDIHLGTKGGREKGSIPAGTLVTSDLISRLKNNKIDSVPVRTPLKCSHGQGLCAKCYGVSVDGQLYPSGTNVGIIAAQALGEPAVQLSMNSFHEGGIVGAKGTSATSVFKRLEQLIGMPHQLPGAATLAEVSGKVEKVEKDPAGGWNVFVKGQRHYVPSSLALEVKSGTKVDVGDSLSTGVKDPRKLLALQGMPSVQKYLTDEIWRVYRNEGPVKRRNIEAFVRALTNLSEVEDPGDHPIWLSGDRIPTSEAQAHNSKLPAGKRPVILNPVLQSAALLPIDMQTDWLARLQSRELKSTVLDAAAERWRSAVHGTHPIPGMAVGKFFGEGTKEEPWLY